MADHVRQQLREAAVTVLTGLPTTGSRVYASRVLPVGRTELPALCVYTPSELSVASTIHSPIVYDREVTLTVEGHVKSVGEQVDTVLDRIALEVETALAPGLIGGQVQVLYSGFDTQFDEADEPIGVISMTFTARVFTAANAPDVLS